MNDSWKDELIYKYGCLYAKAMEQISELQRDKEKLEVENATLTAEIQKLRVGYGYESGVKNERERWEGKVEKLIKFMDKFYEIR